ncbi:WD40-repeat-containing domain protein [Fennellomyces sp. T-0311]|nr:WD40-repeat-containing domain protein [Fennellomyces sp. T-0311]
MPGSYTDDRRFPTELLLAVFVHLDGSSLASCAAVCRQWHGVVNNYDHVIWKACAHRDFRKGSARRFWSLHFPSPQVYNQLTPSRKRTWQDMYRVTKNWFTGNCYGSFPEMQEPAKALFPHVVVGLPQEHTFGTTLTVTSTGHIVRSNPTYRGPDGLQCLMIQCPWTHENQYLGATQGQRMHTVFCHYTHPASKWLVTGSLDGTVALWDVGEKRMVRLWDGHRGRVLCVAMNDQVVVSGGSDSMIRVWDLSEDTGARRGMIDISSYLSARSDWIQGVGEIAVNEHLVACSPDASGPILVFSLLTGSLVYELSTAKTSLRSTLDWDSGEEEMTGFTKLCLTPYFLLTKGKLPSPSDDVPVLPRSSKTLVRATSGTKDRSSFGYIARLDDTMPPPPATASQMTPYQLYQYYQSINHEPSSASLSSSSASSSSSTEADNAKHIRGCINVWDLQTGNIVYRLVPEFDQPPETGYIITDIRASPDSSKVFACVELRRRHHRQEKLYCWDFAGAQRDSAPDLQVTVVQMDGRKNADPCRHRQTVGNSWICFL